MTLKAYMVRSGDLKSVHNLRVYTVRSADFESVHGDVGVR